MIYISLLKFYKLGLAIYIQAWKAENRSLGISLLPSSIRVHGVSKACQYFCALSSLGPSAMCKLVNRHGLGPPLNAVTR